MGGHPKRLQRKSEDAILKLSSRARQEEAQPALTNKSRLTVSSPFSSLAHHHPVDASSFSSTTLSLPSLFSSHSLWLSLCSSVHDHSPPSSSPFFYRRPLGGFPFLTFFTSLLVYRAAFFPGRHVKRGPKTTPSATSVPPHFFNRKRRLYHHLINCPRRNKRERRR